MATLFVASFVGAMVGVFLMIFKGKDSKFAVPFGPFIAAGAYFSALFGDAVIRWYLGGMGL